MKWRTHGTNTTEKNVVSDKVHHKRLGENNGDGGGPQRGNATDIGESLSHFRVLLHEVREVP